MLKRNFKRKNLSIKINKKIGFSKNFSSKIVDSFFNILTRELSKSSNIKITSFGTFSVKKKNERIGRNPKTKIEVKIPSRKVITFKPSKQIKEKINN
jgi:integration host factor subunit alpha